MTEERLWILLIEDDVADACTFRRCADGSRAYRIEVDHVVTSEQAFQKLSGCNYDLIFLDCRLGEPFTGLDTLRRLRAEGVDIPLVILTGMGDERTAVEMMKAGATDYLGKYSFNAAVLERSIRYGLNQQRLLVAHRQAEAELRRSRQELRKLATYLQSVREEERRRVAHTIHDELAQALTVLKMDLSWLVRRLPKGTGRTQGSREVADRIEVHRKANGEVADPTEPLRGKARDMATVIDRTVRAVERISTDLTPPLLDHLGLGAATEWHVEEFQQHSGITCDLDIDVKDVVWERDTSTALFRILQEALTNVARHGHASKVKVSLKAVAGKVVLRVHDNGIGITRERLADSHAFGLIGMRERALSLGGSVRIRGRPGKGTTVTVTVPPSKDRDTHGTGSYC